MAMSKCPKCDGFSFEVKENSPAYSNYKIMFVQCNRCGCVVGTMDYWNIGSKINDLEKKINSLSFSGSINHLNNNLQIINNNVLELTRLVKSIKS